MSEYYKYEVSGECVDVDTMFRIRDHLVDQVFEEIAKLHLVPIQEPDFEEVKILEKKVTFKMTVQCTNVDS